MKTLIQSRTFWLACAQAIMAIIVIVETNYPGLELGGTVIFLKSGLDIWLRMQTSKTIV